MLFHTAQAIVGPGRGDSVVGAVACASGELVSILSHNCKQALPPPLVARTSKHSCFSHPRFFVGKSPPGGGGGGGG